MILRGRARLRKSKTRVSQQAAKVQKEEESLHHVAIFPGIVTDEEIRAHGHIASAVSQDWKGKRIQ